MSKLFLLRHGESFANKANRFSGWLDVGLTAKGVKEAQQTGEMLKDIKFDEVYTSMLSRALMTAMIILAGNDKTYFPLLSHNSKSQKTKYHKISATIERKTTSIYQDERLNERFYGALQGAKVEESRKYLNDGGGNLWKVSFSKIKTAENLSDTLKRTGDFYNKVITPMLESGKNILVVSHGTCIGALLTHILNIGIEEISSHELPNGIPMIFSYSNNKFRVIKS